MEKEIVIADGLKEVKIKEKELVATFTNPDKIEALLSGIREVAEAEAAKVPQDMSKGVNRTALKSVGAKIGTNKIGLEKTAKALVDAEKASIQETQDRIDGINKSKNKISEALKNERIKIVKPAKDWEKREKEQKEQVQCRIEIIHDYGNLTQENGDHLYKGLAALEAMEIGPEFGKFQEEAQVAKDNSIKLLSNTIELMKLRQKEEKRLAEEEEKKRKEEARKEAEALAEQKAEHLKKQKWEAEQKSEQQRVSNIKSEIEYIRKHNPANPQNINFKHSSSDILEYSLKQMQSTPVENGGYGEFKEEAKKELEETIKQLKAQILLTKEKERQADEQRKKELQKKADQEAAAKLKKEQESKAVAEAERQADQNHRKQVQSRIKEDLIKCGFEAGIAAKLVFSIDMGKVRDLVIKY